MDLDIKKDLTSNWFKLLQDAFCNDISKLENHKTKFKSTTWKRSPDKDEGGGEYRILRDGKVFDKVGVNYSKVYGKFPKKFQKNIRGASKDPRFWASGISVVMHMKNPLIPAMHFNTRFISTTQQWFGGGMDVTPSKKDDLEKKDFHKDLMKMCNRHNKNYYKKYKKWCDEYFYLPHRKEPRGIGGIFFDYKNDNFEKDFKFVRDVGVTFQMLFNKIIRKKLNRKWTLNDKELQYIKRGRYAEFNLLYDRGTKFGLQTGGNVEGILMSLPPLAKWK
ncbi:oxygen-dependent coproporphyrinogen oxidase [Candidatus Pelagibacter sp.]|jgi:coproporphyrinogen III oxidase|nr:oxygen-dependent coproporphyrinogen oxidase [Candidatus Pelagibacter bacterium]MDB3931659.1 oxygen-dependent coproporphyrinogen oxidase [Candidatus Pelagibacter sp.]NDG89300.1 oxygen-dependent coproporphyrinogen oxidase [Pseudomonadota bacterium]MDC0394108.1 oxygen-dependent coproporphyrinogen oxidase [Candidatus Pelagibacter sp.]MDC0631723.1 oxygen-dependent coproporphyrinogen oxidase [Candidatus Pelagibacter sp.]|tara:strand:- start:679 stop:1506 length:828 start_codon:yes stop_codon:yes gene_type:complete